MVHTCFVCKRRSDKSQGLSFHRFPSNTVNRQQWLDILGQSKLPGKGAAVCSSHFDTKCFRYGLVKGRELLKPGSKPTLNLGKQDQKRVATNISYETSESCNNDILDDSSTISCRVLTDTSKNERLLDSNVVKMPLPQSNNISHNERAVDSIITKLTISNKQRQEMPLTEVIPKKKIRTASITWEEFSMASDQQEIWQSAIQEIKSRQKKIECLQRKNRRLRQKVLSTKLLTKHLSKKDLLMENEAKFLHSTMDPIAEALFKQIVSKKKKISEFPLGLRTFAATLLFLSPKAYAYTRKIFSFSLPHPSTVRKWFTSIDGKPGISNPALQVLEEKVLDARKKGKALLCSIIVDDMAIRKHIRWNGKNYSGFVTDTNDNARKKKESTMVTQAMVVMVVCLNEHWKIPMSYYLINSLRGEERAKLLSQCFANLHKIGVNVVSLTFDGAASNIRMAKELGAKISFTEKDSRIHFPHPVTKEPIFVIIDPCHAIKLIRNALAEKKVLYDGEGNAINWEYFVALVRIQYQYGLHAGTKIRKRHLNWAQEKMKVKLATQTFSASTAHALNLLRSDIKVPEFVGSEATETFCLIINNCFDILNSRQKVSKVPSKQCINKDNVEEIRLNIEKYKRYISSLKDGNKSIFESIRRMGFFGIVSALENVIAIFDKWYTSEIAPLEYLITYKLSQDHLELFFSAVRTKGGHNNNPTAEQFESAFKWLLVYAQIRGSASANCLSQDRTCLLQTSKTVLAKTTLMRRDNDSVGTHEIAEAVPFSPTLDHDYCIPSAFTNVNIMYINHIVAYIAGFVAKSLNKSVKCTHCTKLLNSAQAFSAIQIKKCQGRLTKASAELIQVCLIAEQRFRMHNVFQTENILNVLIRSTLEYIPPTAFENKENCGADYRSKLLVKILKVFFKIRLHHKGTSKLEQQEELRIRTKSNKIVLFKNQ